MERRTAWEEGATEGNRLHLEGVGAVWSPCSRLSAIDGDNIPELSLDELPQSKCSDIAVLVGHIHGVGRITLLSEEAKGKDEGVRGKYAGR